MLENNTISDRYSPSSIGFKKAGIIECKKSKFSTLRLLDFSALKPFTFSPVHCSLFRLPFTQKAFTLAEVLLVLGIIGIVAALTIPTLMKSTNDLEFKTAFKKAYAGANKAYLQAVNDNGGGFGAFSSNTTTAYTKFNALKAEMAVIQDCPFGSTIKGVCWSDSGVGLKGYSITNYALASNIDSTAQFTNTSFVSKDGMFWMLYCYTATNGSDVILVDVNGNKGPNDWGKDAFILQMVDTSISLFPADQVPYLKHNDGTALTGDEFVNALSD